MKSITVKYYRYNRNAGITKKEFSHQYIEPWMETELFCPFCGSKAVWRNEDGGDYYVGEQHLCVEGKHSFYLPGWEEVGIIGEQDEQRLEGLNA